MFTAPQTRTHTRDCLSSKWADTSELRRSQESDVPPPSCRLVFYLWAHIAPLQCDMKQLFSCHPTTLRANTASLTTAWLSTCTLERKKGVLRAEFGTGNWEKYLSVTLKEIELICVILNMNVEEVRVPRQVSHSCQSDNPRATWMPPPGKQWPSGIQSMLFCILSSFWHSVLQ